MHRVSLAANSGITVLSRRARLGPTMRTMLGDGQVIKSETEFLDTMLELVKATETDHEYAVATVVTLARLIERGYDGLAFEVLETFRPGA